MVRFPNMFFYVPKSAGRLLAIAFMLVAGGLTSRAQTTHAVAKLDTNRIRIGEQTRLQLLATVPEGASVSFPVIADSIHKLEVLSKSAIDTSRSQDGLSVTYHQSLTLTGFDSGFFVVEPFTFRIKNS